MSGFFFFFDANQICSSMHGWYVLELGIVEIWEVVEISERKGDMTSEISTISEIPREVMLAYVGLLTLVAGISMMGVAVLVEVAASFGMTARLPETGS